MIAALVLGGGAAWAQEDGPLRFLKPWLKTLEGEAATAVPEPSVPAPEAALPDPGEPAATGATNAAPPVAEEDRPPPEAAIAVPAQPPPADAPPPAPPPPVALRLGVLAGRDAGALLRALTPLADGLADALGRPVQFFPLPTHAAMIDAQASERIDGAFFSATAYALAQARCACLEPLAAPAAEPGDTAFHAIVVARRDSGLRALADLKGKRIAAGAADSLGARLVQMAALEAEGIEATSGGLVDAGSADEAVLRLLDGDADAAFAWSSLTGDQARGYSRGTLADLWLAGDIAMDELAILWRSPPITHGPFAVRRSLAEEEKLKIASYLMVLDEASPAAYDALNPLYGGGYAEVGAADYRGVEEVVARAKP